MRRHWTPSRFHFGFPLSTLSDGAVRLGWIWAALRVQAGPVMAWGPRCFGSGGLCIWSVGIGAAPSLFWVVPSHRLLPTHAAIHGRALRLDRAEGQLFADQPRARSRIEKIDIAQRMAFERRASAAP